MPFDRFKHNRRSIRLPGYDYSSPGVYFVTIDTHRSAPLFGEIIGGAMRLNEWGAIADAEWLRTADLRHEIELDEFIIMPNHMHGIIMINDGETIGAARRIAWKTVPAKNAGAHGRAPLRRSPRSLGSLIAGYKSAVTIKINNARGIPGTKIWQRNYYEHIIRDENELIRIREYIRNNPMRWDMDAENR